MDMRARAWGPFAVLLSMPIVVASGGPSPVVHAVVAGLTALALTMPLGDMMRVRGRARPGSLVDGADARRPWLLALAGSLLLLMMRLVPSWSWSWSFFRQPPPLGPSLVLGAAGLAFAALVFVDVRALWRLRLGLARPATLRPCTPGSPPPDRATLIVDFGVGDEAREELAPSPAVYREPDRVVRLVRGSLPAARRALWRGLACDLFIVMPSLIAIVALLVGRLGLQ